MDKFSVMTSSLLGISPDEDDWKKIDQQAFDCAALQLAAVLNDLRGRLGDDGLAKIALGSVICNMFYHYATFIADAHGGDRGQVLDATVARLREKLSLAKQDPANYTGEPGQA
jgi:hypothetical protein